MKIYLDSSAIVKLVQREPESDALRTFMDAHRSDTFVTSMLSRTEVIRAVLSGGEDAAQHARRQLARFDQIMITPAVLDRASELTPTRFLRSLDAIHISSAQIAMSDLRSVVTYDLRMAAAASAIGLSVDAPE